MRPGAGLYIADAGSCVHEPIHHIFCSFDGQHRKMGCCPLHKIEVLHLYRWYTHTPGRSRVNPSRQKEEKSGHKRRANGQNSAEGEGSKRTSRTNLHRETDLTTPRHITEGHGDKVDKLEASPRLQDRALFPRRDGRRSTHKWA